MTERSTDVDALRAAYDAVLARIAAACDRAGREPSDVTLVAVSKTVDAERLTAAVAAAPRVERSVGEPQPAKRSTTYDADDLEIPSFLRRK